MKRGPDKWQELGVEKTQRHLTPSSVGLGLDGPSNTRTYHATHALGRQGPATHKALGLFGMPW